MSSKIEEAAVAFIEARRRKLEAKYRRNELLNECQIDGSDRSCSFENPDASTWCEKCVEAAGQSFEYQRARGETNNALKVLERIVMKMQENPGPIVLRR